MQTLYGYKGNTPIIAQYGVHKFWGFRHETDKTRREKKKGKHKNDIHPTVEHIARGRLQGRRGRRSGRDGYIKQSSRTRSG